MASHRSVPNKVELSAVTSTLHEHVALNWTVNNFKTLIESAPAAALNEGSVVVVASLPFKLVNIN